MVRPPTLLTPRDFVHAPAHLRRRLPQHPPAGTADLQLLRTVLRCHRSAHRRPGAHARFGQPFDGHGRHARRPGTRCSRRRTTPTGHENTVSHIATWVIAGLRQEQFTSLMQLRGRIREQIDAYNRQPFQKREGFRLSFGAGTGNERPPTGSARPPTAARRSLPWYTCRARPWRRGLNHLHVVAQKDIPLPAVLGLAYKLARVRAQRTGRPGSMRTVSHCMSLALLVACSAEGLCSAWYHAAASPVGSALARRLVSGQASSGPGWNESTRGGPALYISGFGPALVALCAYPGQGIHSLRERSSKTP